MQDPADLTLFAHIAKRSEESLDLAMAALLIAAGDYPDLDIPSHLEELDALAVELSSRIDLKAPRASVLSLLDLLYKELGFHGNERDYYDPRNSFLNEVLRRRTGIPISLALVVCEVGRRAGLKATGVSFPGHFLVRVEAGPAETPLLIDPFKGALLDRLELRTLRARATGQTGIGERDIDPKQLHSATKVQFLVRMLHNLQGIYSERGDRERLRATLEKIQILSPSDELERQIEQLGGENRPFIPGNRGSN